MGRRLCARSEAASIAIAEVLAAADGLMTTGDIAVAAGYQPHDPLVWRMLDRLERVGVAERVKDPEAYSVSWRELDEDARIAAELEAEP